MKSISHVKSSLAAVVLSLTAQVTAASNFSTDSGINVKYPKYSKYSKSLSILVEEYLNINNPKNITKILVMEKRKQRLTVYINGDKIKSYQAAHSGVLDDKEVEGDLKTPAGIFFLERKKNSRFYKPLLISYPLPEDAERGLKEGIISKTRYKEIISAHKACRIPQQRMGGLGGQLLIHGGGSSSNWTYGCIGLNNADMDEIYEFIEPGCKGTKLIISKEEFTPMKETSFEEKVIQTLGSTLFQSYEENKL